MNCSQVQNLMSAYHDGELPSADAVFVAQHLAECASCQSILDGFRDMSRLASELRSPAVMTDGSWHELEPKNSLPQAARPWNNQPSIAVIAIAASLLVAVGAAMWLGSNSNYSKSNREQVASGFDVFLKQFSRDPSSAQSVLLTSFNGRQVDLKEAEETLGYVPAAIDNAPAGYVVNGVYLLDMPACRCLETNCPRGDCGKGGECKCGGTCGCSQVVYRSSTGRTMSVFEHPEPDVEWFGNRPTIRCECNGVPTELVEIDSQQLAATWKRGDRYVTLVGAVNLEEVKHVMEHLQANATTPADKKLLETKAS